MINSIREKEKTYTHKSNKGLKGYIIDSTLAPWPKRFIWELIMYVILTIFFNVGDASHWSAKVLHVLWHYFSIFLLILLGWLWGVSLWSLILLSLMVNLWTNLFLKVTWDKEITFLLIYLFYVLRYFQDWWSKELIMGDYMVLK